MRLGNEFYKLDAVTAARELIGKLLIRELDGKKIICRIVETEAYVGPEDKGCHAYQNKKSERTKVMFNKGGCAYIFLIYGMYSCLNIVVNEIDKPEAVLIRALEPIKGIEIIKKNRDIGKRKIENLTNGPGKLTMALKISRELNGYDLVSGNEIYIEEDNKNDFSVVSGKRINIDYAGEYKEKLWRFYIEGNPYVSV